MNLRPDILILVLTGTLLTAAEPDPFTVGLAHKATGDLPAAEAAFRTAWTADPSRLDALEQLATVTGWRGDHRGALALWDELLARDPGRTPAHLARARVLYWMGRLGDSRAALDELARANPGQAEIAELRGDVARAAGDWATAEAAYTAAGTPTALGKLAQTAAGGAEPMRRWRFDLSASGDRFHASPPGAAPRDDEYLLTMQLGRTLGADTALSAGIEQSLQFGFVDRRLNVTGYWSPRLTPDHRLELELRLAATPSAEILPEAESILNTAATLHANAAVVFAASRRWYPDNRVDSLQPGLRLRFFDALEVEGRWVFGSSEQEPNTDAILLRAGLDGLGRWRPGLLYSKGEDNLPPTGVAKTTTYGATLQVDLGGGHGLRFDLGYEERERSPNRINAGLGWTVRW